MPWAALPRLLPCGACRHLSEEDVDQRGRSRSPCAVSHRAPALKSKPPGRGAPRPASGPRGRHRAPPAPRHRAGLAAPPASAPGSALRAHEPRGESSLAALAGAALPSLSCAGGRHTARPAGGLGGRWDSRGLAQAASPRGGEGVHGAVPPTQGLAVGWGSPAAFPLGGFRAAGPGNASPVPAQLKRPCVPGGPAALSLVRRAGHPQTGRRTRQKQQAGAG